METRSMKLRGEAEGNEANRSAGTAGADRNVGMGAVGASSAASEESHPIGQGSGLIEQMVERSYLAAAWKRVRQNKGAEGVDGLDIEATETLIRKEWGGIKNRLLAGTYVPRAVRRVEIPKPKGGTRKLGVPTVLDRFIQQAALQVLSPLFEPSFSEGSYGFRPGRSAHQAVLAAKEYQKAGRKWVVDLDLASFFDEVDHDLLMARVRRKVKDVRMLRLVRSYLNCGAMIAGISEQTETGTPQGGPLSPLLSNILLDDLDKELEKRGHSFCRYADDCNIYVGSKRSGERVMASATRFLQGKMKLKVNHEKSAVARPAHRIFLGYSFTLHKEPKIRVPSKTCEKLKEKLKHCFRMGRGQNVERFIRETLNPLLRGWITYFRLSEATRFAQEMDQWVRRHLRCLIWRQWKRPATRRHRMVALGLGQERSMLSANNGRGPWFNSGASHMIQAIPEAALTAMGLTNLLNTLNLLATPSS
jgi:RNA-directed DNA polymerase